MSEDTLQPEISTRLQGKTLFLARAGWAFVAALSLSLGTPAVIIYSWMFFQRPNFSWFLFSIPELTPFRWMLQFLLYAILAVFIFWRRSDDKMALLASATLLAVGGATNTWELWLKSEQPVLLRLFLAMIIIMAVVFSLVFFSIFPDGRFFPKWTRVIIGPLIGELLLLQILKFSEQLQRVVDFTFAGLFVVGFSASISGQIYRYRHISSPSQRQQTKWFVWGLIIMILMIVLVSIGVLLIEIVNFYFPNVTTLNIFAEVVGYSNGFIFFLLPFVLPVCLLISIFKYRLWGIDFLINRSLVYGMLSLLLVFVFGITLYLTSFITQGQSSFLTFGMAAVVAGAMFQPTRLTFQRFIDRRFYNVQIDYQKLPTPKNMSQILKQTRFGDYQTLELIGRGGMAEVYKSIHPVLNTPVAIKILPVSLATDPEFRNRFIREAEIVTKLEHPNIIRIFDYGEQDDTHYMVMEYLAGRDLSAFLRTNGRLSLALALPFIQNITDALDYAHAIGLVHRDIKPSNILLDDTGHFAKLTDFGIAKLLGHTAMTSSGKMLGTFDYIAPEQIQASADVDGRADVYALGVMVYQMLTGELPFKYNNLGALLIAHLNEPPPDPRKIVTNLPSNVAQAIQRAMAKDPADRFTTAGEFAVALNKNEN